MHPQCLGQQQPAQKRTHPQSQPPIALALQAAVLFGAQMSLTIGDDIRCVKRGIRNQTDNRIRA
jgi:hypothetical protein